LALDGAEWSASRFGRFTPGERVLGGHWLGGWVGPTVGQEWWRRGKNPCPCRTSNPCRQAKLVELSRGQPWSMWYTL